MCDDKLKSCIKNFHIKLNTWITAAMEPTKVSKSSTDNQTDAFCNVSTTKNNSYKLKKPAILSLYQSDIQSESDNNLINCKWSSCDNKSHELRQEIESKSNIIEVGYNRYGGNLYSNITSDNGLVEKVINVALNIEQAKISREFDLTLFLPFHPN